MAKYSASNTLGGTQQASTSTYITLLSLTAISTTNTRRIKVYDILVGTDTNAPADQAYTYDLSRVTAVGTATNVTPTILDPADGAALTQANANNTIEPTVTAASSVWSVGVNQRASYRWVAAPGSEFVGPATTANGFGLRTKSASGGTTKATGTALFEEQ